MKNNHKNWSRGLVSCADQTIKYSLRSKEITAIEMFKRKDVHFDPVDKRMCKDIRSPASKYISKLRENQKKRAERLEAYGSVKSGPATLAKEKVQKAAEAQRAAHSEERKKARKRALETLVSKKRKVANID